LRAYRGIIERFIQEFGDGPVEQVTPEQILQVCNEPFDGLLKLSQGLISDTQGEGDQTSPNRPF
jgi:hypothetical protein